MNSKWQYRTLKFKTKGLLGGRIDETEFTKSLNELGEQGWELVTSFATSRQGGPTREVVAVLKRSN
jgi:hypothetical protein